MIYYKREEGLSGRLSTRSLVFPCSRALLPLQSIPPSLYIYIYITPCTLSRALQKTKGGPLLEILLPQTYQPHFLVEAAAILTITITLEIKIICLDCHYHFHPFRIISLRYRFSLLITSLLKRGMYRRLRDSGMLRLILGFGSEFGICLAVIILNFISVVIFIFIIITFVVIVCYCHCFCCFMGESTCTGLLKRVKMS